MARPILSRATGAVCAVLLPAGAVLAGADLVAYPDGYEESFTHFTTRNRADERKQVVKILPMMSPWSAPRAAPSRAAR